MPGQPLLHPGAINAEPDAEAGQVSWIAAIVIIRAISSR